MIISENLEVRKDGQGNVFAHIPFQIDEGPREFAIPIPRFSWVDLDNFPILPGEDDALTYGQRLPIVEEQVQQKYIAPIAFGIVDFMTRHLYSFGCDTWDISIALGMKATDGHGEDPAIIYGRYSDDPNAHVMGMISTVEYGLLANTPNLERKQLEPLKSVTWLRMYYLIREAVTMGAKEFRIVFSSTGVDIAYRDEDSSPAMEHVGGMWMTSRLSN